MDKGVYIMTLSEPLEKTSASKHRTENCFVYTCTSGFQAYDMAHKLSRLLQMVAKFLYRTFHFTFIMVLWVSSLFCIVLYTASPVLCFFLLCMYMFYLRVRFDALFVFSLTRVCILYDVFSLFKIWFKGIKVLPISQSRLLSFSQEKEKHNNNRYSILIITAHLPNLLHG